MTDTICTSSPTCVLEGDTSADTPLRTYLPIPYDYGCIGMLLGESFIEGGFWAVLKIQMLL